MPSDLLILEAIDRLHIALEMLLMGVWAVAIVNLGQFVHNVLTRRRG
jgi:hypothetical protein